jgi:hypothetical protein
MALQICEIGGQRAVTSHLGAHRNVVQLRDLAVDHGTSSITFVQHFQVLQYVDGSLTEDILRGSVKGLGKDEVRVFAYPDDQRVRGQDSLDKIDGLSDAVVGGDEGDVIIASVLNETGRGLIGTCLMARSGWMCVGVKEGIADIALEQWSAIGGTDMWCIIRERCRL